MTHNQISAICRHVLITKGILANHSDTPIDTNWDQPTFDFCQKYAYQQPSLSEKQLITQYETEVVEVIKAASVSKIDRAIEIAVRYGGTDEMHHLQWVVDQMVRILAGDNYDKIVKEAKVGEEGPDTYKWSTGTAP